MDLKLFFSWQVETNDQGFNNKSFLTECINSAINQIQGKGDLKGVKIIYDDGLRKSPGTPDVALEMFEKIDECDIFIGDMTVVQHLEEWLDEFRNKEGIYFRYGPNSNVFGEYNRALGKSSLFYKQVILLMNEANRSVYEDIAVIPFDTRGRRWPITFNLPDNSDESKKKTKEELLKVLPDAIRLSALAARENISNKFDPFVGWFFQHKDNNLYLSHINDALVAKYRASLLGDAKVVRVIGPEDKTEIVHRACDENEVANNYLYVDGDVYNFDDYRDKLKMIFKDYPSAIVVIDKCPIEDMKKVLKIKNMYSADNRIISLSKNEEEEYISDSSMVLLDVREDIDSALNQVLYDSGVKNLVIQNHIKDFFQNDSKLVTSITDSLRGDEELEDFEQTKLNARLVDADSGSNERIILQSLSLFDCIGWKDERAGELDVIIGNKSITSIDSDFEILKNETIAIIKKNIKRGIILEKGRTISVHPKELAIQLQQEWLETVNGDRLLSALSSVIESGSGASLIKEFRNRFRYLGQSEEAKEIVKSLLKVGSKFESLEVLDSNEGSMLIESFAEVNPEVVADFLTRTINTRTTGELYGISKGRRYIIWTLEKLCFKQETFIRGASLMLKFALAENESISNNATGQFKRLFPVMLPATEISLEARLKFLQDAIKVEPYKAIIMDTVKVALHTRDFIYMDGAETFGGNKLKSYMPSRSECFDYIKGCLDLVKEEVEGNSVAAESGLETIENNFAVLCDFGAEGIILPVVDSIARFKSYNWDKLQESMARFKDQVWSNINPENKRLYEDILSRLTKTDPISKFKRVEKEAFNNRNFEYGLKQRREIYKELAKEFIEKGLVTKDNLRELIHTDNISSDPFGATLAEGMSEVEQVNFVNTYLEILAEVENLRIDILCNFVSVLKDKTFEALLPKIMQSPVSSITYACMGVRNIKPNNLLFENLKLLIKEGNASVSDFIQYWTMIPINGFTMEDLELLFNTVQNFDNSLPVILRMYSFLCYNKKPESLQSICSIVEKALLEYDDEAKPLINVENALHVSCTLLADGSHQVLAKRINDEILAYARQTETYFTVSYEIEEIYHLLMLKYFDVIWPSLSEALLASDEQFMTYYHLKELLGTDMVSESAPILMVGDHFQAFLDWCNKYPDIAPARLASMIQVADGNTFTPEAMALIDNYADKQYVLNEIGCNLDSFASVGSVVPYYERRKNIYSTLLEHNNPDVRQWAQSQVNACQYMIERESSFEEEKL